MSPVAGRFGHKGQIAAAHILAVPRGLYSRAMSKPSRNNSSGPVAGRRKRLRGGPWPAVRRFLLRAMIAGLTICALYVAYLDAVVTNTFDAHRWTVPARVYARPLDLYAGRPLTVAALLGELRELGYREVAAPAAQGEFAISADGLTVQLVARGFAFPEGRTRPQKATIAFSAARIERLTAADRVLRLEPVVIGTIRPKDAEDRVLMRLGERPPFLLETLLAVEDRNFPEHIGISPRGMLRALWVNVKSGEVQQGGSTLTQQLVKNFYLDNERTVTRKLIEAIMAVLLEVHYDKNTILETYCNEIYLGQAGRRAVHGFALGSLYYFGRPVAELQLQEVALLVGLIKGPSQLNPWRHPERARERRNTVLDALVATGGVDRVRAETAKNLPLNIVPTPRLRLNRYPAYMAIVRAELQSRLDNEALTGDGLAVFTALDPGVQQAAEAALAQTLVQIEKDNGMTGLEGALVVSVPQTGEIEAAVGGRDVDFAGFNRVVDARRTIGSLMKPVVFLAALQQPQRYSLASFISDAPISAKVKGSPDWRPGNYDHVSHGNPPDHQVMLVDALANSWNQATARLGLELGIETVIRQARTLGVDAELPPYPALLLGSATLSPLEVLGMYQPLASGGLRIRPRAVRGVLAADGTVLLVRETRTERVLSPATAFLLTHAMQETVRRGTARSVYNLLSREIDAAGKTGTTDNARDSWFAGFTGSHLAIAWVGYDDNRATALSGATGALRVWADFTGRLPQMALSPVAPTGVEWAWLVPGGEARAAEGCGAAVRVPVIAGTVPEKATLCGTTVEAVEGVKGFFRRLVE